MRRSTRTVSALSLGLGPQSSTSAVYGHKPVACRQLRDRGSPGTKEGNGRCQSQIRCPFGRISCRGISSPGARLADLNRPLAFARPRSFSTQHRVCPICYTAIQMPRGARPIGPRSHQRPAQPGANRQTRVKEKTPQAGGVAGPWRWRARSPAIWCGCERLIPSSGVCSQPLQAICSSSDPSCKHLVTSRSRQLPIRARPCGGRNS